MKRANLLMSMQMSGMSREQQASSEREEEREKRMVVIIVFSWNEHFTIVMTLHCRVCRLKKKVTVKCFKSKNTSQCVQWKQKSKVVQEIQKTKNWSSTEFCIWWILKVDKSDKLQSFVDQVVFLRKKLFKNMQKPMRQTLPTFYNLWWKAKNMKPLDKKSPVTTESLKGVCVL